MGTKNICMTFKNKKAECGSKSSNLFISPKTMFYCFSFCWDFSPRTVERCNV